MPNAPIPFTGNPLDRRSAWRSDAAAMMARLHDPSSLILPLSENAPLFTGEEPHLKPAFLPSALCEPLEADHCIFLGEAPEEMGVRSYFALDLAGLDFAARDRIAVLGRFLDLRASAPMLSLADLAIASHAKAMTEWHGRSRFCGRCGAQTHPADAGNKRVCPACHAEEFPRTDPAVIMLALHEDKCLLARNVKWAPDFFSTLAGFVEPGESLEEAVAREASEEAGVRVRSVRYFTSQPWPFPAALMLGFFAEVESAELKLDESEIAEAQWFSREEAKDLIGGKMPGRRGPAPFAIAYHLIRTWVKGRE
jgi:NAD+ diphosphatase